MNLTRLQTFVEVVRRGTFAGAAEALSFTPSAVSQQMTKLEAETGTSLLVREAGGVRLTEAGRLLHEHAAGIVEAVRHAQAQLDALEAEQVKRLRLGACPVAAGAVLPRALRLVRRRLPAADLVVEEAAADEVRTAVIDGRLDVGVWLGVGGDDPRLVETVLRREPLCAAIAADHPLTRLDELDAEALAATPQLAGYSLGTALALVAAGEGWAAVPGLAVAPGVAVLPLAGAPEWELRAARPAGEVLSVGTLAVLDALRRVTESGRGPRVAPAARSLAAGTQ